LSARRGSASLERSQIPLLEHGARFKLTIAIGLLVYWAKSEVLMFGLCDLGGIDISTLNTAVTGLRFLLTHPFSVFAV
jgi:hypothetical protein